MHMFQGLKDHISGNEKLGIISTAGKIESGKYARDILTAYKRARHE